MLELLMAMVIVTNIPVVNVQPTSSAVPSLFSGAGDPAPTLALPVGEGLSNWRQAGLLAAATTLDEVESDILRHMREEEKLAHDVYLTLYEQWDLPVFSNIARSEQNHMNAVLVLFDRYGLEDTVADQGVGEFENPDLQALYDSLIAQGRESLAAALEVGVLIEETDLADLQAAINSTDNPDLQRVYSHLQRGSENHLQAFRSAQQGDRPCGSGGQRQQNRGGRGRSF
jgi:hypothetical protein